MTESAQLQGRWTIDRVQQVNCEALRTQEHSQQDQGGIQFLFERSQSLLCGLHLRALLYNEIARPEESWPRLAPGLLFLGVHILPCHGLLVYLGVKGYLPPCDI